MLCYYTVKPLGTEAYVPEGRLVWSLVIIYKKRHYLYVFTLSESAAVIIKHLDIFLKNHS